MCINALFLKKKMAVLLCDVLFFLGFVGWSREKWRTKRRGCDKGAKQSPGL